MPNDWIFARSYLRIFWTFQKIREWLRAKPLLSRSFISLSECLIPLPDAPKMRQECWDSVIFLKSQEEIVQWSYVCEQAIRVKLLKAKQTRPPIKWTSKPWFIGPIYCRTVLWAMVILKLLHEVHIYTLGWPFAWRTCFSVPIFQ